MLIFSFYFLNLYFIYSVFALSWVNFSNIELPFHFCLLCLLIHHLVFYFNTYICISRISVCFFCQIFLGIPNSFLLYVQLCKSFISLKLMYIILRSSESDPSNLFSSWRVFLNVGLLFRYGEVHRSGDCHRKDSW